MRPMLVPTPTARRVRSATWMRRGVCASASAISPVASGACSFRTIIRATSPGRPTWPIRSVSAAISVLALTKLGVPCVSYHGRNATPGYYCAAGAIVNGHGSRCLRVGGQQIDAAVATAFLVACTPAGAQAALAAAQRLEADHDAALAQARMAVERARYEATRAERRYRAVDAENRLVARGLERDWEERLQEVAMAEAELGAREHRRPRGLT